MRIENCVLCLCLLVLPLAASAESSVAGRILDSHGAVDMLRSGQSVWVGVSTPVDLFAGDEIRTGGDGTATLLLADESAIRLNRNTRITLKQIGIGSGWNRVSGLLKASAQSVKSAYQLLSGELWIRNNNPDVEVGIETPTITAGLRGTELNIKVDPAGLVRIAVLEGRVEATNSMGSIEAQVGEEISARVGSAPTKKVLLRPEDTVQWTIRLPELLNLHSLPAGTAVEIRRAMAEIASGQPGDAGAALGDYLTRQPADAVAWRLLALASLITNDREQAYTAVDRAAALDAGSAELWLTRAYIEQSRGDLTAAEASARRALEIDGRNASALLLIAEMQFAGERTSEAEATIDRAVALVGDSTDIHSLKGYIALARLDEEAALAAFQSALELDGGNGEAYLGLALTQMRRGDIAAALRSINSAVALEPQRSLFLSYWGKLLYQLGRYDKAFVVLESAARVDPLDPTPHYYRSLMERDLNLAGESIRSLNQAIALNGNRAVYRSSFLLDRDVASRNIDLSLVYAGLGLYAWGESLALRSVQLDQANSSAHVFLGNVLLGRGDRTQAAASENLIARMLLPANVNSFNSFNDYTSFFDIPEINAVVTIGGGTQGGRDLSATVSGALPGHNLAYSLGAFDSQFDGAGIVQGRDSRTVAGTTKWQATPDDALLLSIGISELDFDEIFRDLSEAGGLAYGQTSSGTTDSSRFEIGYHRRLQVDSHLFLYYSHVETDVALLDVLDEELDPGLVFRQQFDSQSKRPLDMLQLHIDSRRDAHQLSVGALLHSGKKKGNATISNVVIFDGETIPFPEFDTLLAGDQDIEFRSVYGRDLWQATETLTLDTALYYETYDNANTFLNTSWSNDQWSPRLGLNWRPDEQTTWRVALFQYLTPFVSRRLDATNVGGVYVPRSEEDGARIREADLSWERNWTSGYLSAGLFYLDREQLDLAQEGAPLRRLDGEDRGLLLQLNQIINDRLGFSASYRLARIENAARPDLDRDDGILRLGLQFVHPSGWFAAVGQTWRRISFADSGQDRDIPLTDLVLAYQLPARRGLLSISALNLFDKDFEWVTDTFSLDERLPERQLAASLSVYF